MPTLATFGDGVTTTFRLPVHNQQATATVGGSAATITSQGPSHVTLASPPALNASVAISYTPAFQSQGGKQPVVIGQSGVLASVTGTVTETALASLVVPANAIGPNGSLRVTALWSAGANNANVKSVIYRLGGVPITSTGVTSTLTYQDQRVMLNRGAQNSQVTYRGASAYGAGSSVAVLLTNIDTSIPQVLTLSAQLAVTTDTVNLEGYLVEVLNP